MAYVLLKRFGGSFAALALAAIAAVSIAADAGLSEQDKDFINKAATAGHAEVAAGKLAASNSQNAELKKFAAQMVADHSKAGAGLAPIAKSKGITPPAGPDDTQNKDLEKLKNAKGDDFDKFYTQTFGINGHKDALTLFRGEAKDGKDAQLKAFAQKTLPTIEHHFKMAEALQKTVEKNGK